MRRTVVISLGLVLSAAVVVGGGWALVQQMQARRLAAAVATAASVEASAAIPQDAAAMEKRRREWLEWSRWTLQGAYDRVGKRDARWDEPARKALERAARRYSLEVDPEVTRGDIFTPASAAVAAGCDDPMVLYLCGLYSAEPNDPGEAEAIRRTRDAAHELAASRYPAIRRAIALQVSANKAVAAGNPDEAARNEAEHDFDAALGLVAESAASDERNEAWEANWIQTAIDLTRGYRALGVAAEDAYARVDAGLAKVNEAKIIRLIYRGDFWLHYGWEARTNAYAYAVPAGGFAKLEKRLAVAQQALREAWELRPGVGPAPRLLMEIDKGVVGDRATMELWFDRAMKANGDDRDACLAKLDWLDPKWHGSAEEMLAFGRACRDTGNWRTGITLLVADAHWRIACRLGGPEQVKYMKRPEVWADIQPVYDEYLKHHPSDDVARTKFATFSYLGGHYREAEAQYVALGDRLAEWTEVPYVPLADLKRNRKFTAEVLMGGTTPYGPQGWHFVGGKNNDGHWRVNIPAAAERKQEAGILGAKAANVWTCAADGVAFRLRVQPVPPALRGAAPERVLEAARAAVAEERGGPAHDVHPATLANRPAEEYQVEAPALRPGVVRVRTAVIGTRLYELSVTANAADVTGKAASEFFDSFTFRALPSPAAAGGKP